MFKSIVFLAVGLSFSSVIAEPESPGKGTDDHRNKGSFSGRILYLGMYRDYDNGNNGHATTLGIRLNYQSPSWAGFDAGFAYNYAGTLFCDGNTKLLCNDDINVLNEAWLRYRFEGHGWGDTQIIAGRKINNGEVFRADNYRQKARSLESVQWISSAIPDTQLTVGHASKLSNWIDDGDRWDFNHFGDVFGTGYETDGVTWAEAVYTGIRDWEVAVFNAHAWDVSHLVGTRIQYQVCDQVSLLGYYRHESDLGRAVSQRSDAYGLSIQQKRGAGFLEAGYWAVKGDKLRFQELTTGINHALGCSMMIYAGQFNGGSQTVYLKATTKIGKTDVYALYNSTWQDQGPYDGQEFNVVIKQPVSDNLSVTFKGGVGTRNGKGGVDDTIATDGRMFLTYTF
jgi:hypothetical protein